MTWHLGGSFLIAWPIYQRVASGVKASNSVCRAQKPDHPVLPSKKNVPNRPAPPYGKPPDFSVPYLYVSLARMPARTRPKVHRVLDVTTKSALTHWVV